MAAPSKFAHVVYNTHRYQEMLDWYTLVFEATTQYGNDGISFLTYDEEHHRFAFINLGPLPDDAPEPRMGRGAGVHHVAYTWDSLEDLVQLYKRLRDAGITPQIPMKHGMTFSMYYADPDGNMMEFQVDLCDVETANEFMHSAAFENNPIGELFDPEEFLKQYEAGVPPEELVFRSDQTPLPLI